MYIALAVISGVLYILDSAAQVWAMEKENETLRRVTKSLLMPLLVLSFIFARLYLSLDGPWLVAAALMLGCAGDILLIGFKNKVCSPLGAVSFAAGHILYMIQIWRLTPEPGPMVIAAVVAVYLAISGVIYVKLRHYVDKTIVRIGVILYMLPLCVMSASAAVCAFTVLSLGAFVLITGTLVFMLSDGTLSFQIFAGKTRRGHIAVMVTYIIAQALIALGFFMLIA